MTDIVPVIPSPAIPSRREDMVLPGTAERIRAGVPANTSRAYERVWRDWGVWCEANDRTPLPATAATLADFVAHLCDLDRAPATIKQAMAVISKHHQLAGYPKGTPDTSAANLVLRGHRKDRAKRRVRVKEAPPITRARLQQMSASCDRATLAGRRDRLLLVLGWALAGRRSELAALHRNEARVVDRELELFIRASKTDKDAAGELVPVPRGEHVDTDPVGLLLDYLELLDQRAAEQSIDASTGPLLRGVTKQDKLYVPQTVRRVDGVEITYGGMSGDAVDDVVKRVAMQAGLPDAHEYSAHSLRAGFATEAANQGIPVSHWARHGRWNPTSPVPLKYVRAADKKRDNPLRKMGL